MSTAGSPDPAIRSYFFGKGYRDLGATITGSWNSNLSSAQKEFAEAGRLWPGEVPAKAMAILRGTAGVAVMVFGTAFFLAFSALHIVVLATFFLLIYLGFTLVHLAERAYLGVRRFFAVCPDCHSKRPLPEYFCPKCGAIHRRLIPSSYGILHRTCTCGEKLPATFFLKRGELQARCPDCEHLLHVRHIEARKSFVPIFGGPAVGKSALMLAAVRDLIEGEASRLGLETSFVDSRAEGDYQRAVKNLEQGTRPSKTTAKTPRAFNLEVRKAGFGPRLLYLYDPAGELFENQEEVVLNRYQEYLSGLLFLIDPFTLPRVQEEYRDLLPGVKDLLQPSQLPAEDALARVFLGMEEHFGLGKAARVKAPVAVVLTKVDAFDLEERIGETAVARALASRPAAADPERTRDEIIRSQLKRWDQGDLVQQLESRCDRLRYFTCSAFGRMPDSSRQPFEPRGVLEPLLWILGQADPIFARSSQRKAA